YFQQEDYLLEAVESAAAQTYGNLEIIVVDDCSDGRSAEEVLNNFHAPSLKILRHDHNQGPSAARNTAVNASSGDLILALDADDKITADYLEETIECLGRDPGTGAVFTSVQVFGEEESIWHPRFTLAAVLCYGLPNTFLFKRELFSSIGGYNPAMKL